MSKLGVALLQVMPGTSIQENLRIGIDCCREAKRRGADIALFPEMWSVGYTIPEDVEQLRNRAVRIDEDFVETFRLLAKELNMAIGITFLETFDPAPRNTICLFDRFGRLALRYAKVHTCDFGEEKRLTPGDGFSVCELSTEMGTVKIGAMICYDREFPESARVLMLQGAEVLLVPNACPMEINRLSQLRARAFENMVGIATVNYPKGQPDCNGHSTAFDGVAYRPKEPWSRDTLIVEAGEEPGIYLAVFDLDELRNYRATEVHGNAYRHPLRYQILISQEISPPFQRIDRRN